MTIAERNDWKDVVEAAAPDLQYAPTGPGAPLSKDERGEVADILQKFRFSGSPAFDMRRALDDLTAVLARHTVRKEGAAMKTLAVFLFAALLVAGCKTGGKNAPESVAVGSVTSDAVTDDGLQRDFVKVWHYQVTPEVEMLVKARLTPWMEKCDSAGCGPFALTFIDELKQKDGEWVMFECDNPADKIIDHDLVRKLAAPCRTIHETATAYWKANNDPSEFIDLDGKVWRR